MLLCFRTFMAVTLLLPGMKLKKSINVKCSKTLCYHHWRKKVSKCHVQRGNLCLIVLFCSRARYSKSSLHHLKRSVAVKKNNQTHILNYSDLYEKILLNISFPSNTLPLGSKEYTLAGEHRRNSAAVLSNKLHTTDSAMDLVCNKRKVKKLCGKKDMGAKCNIRMVH